MEMMILRRRRPGALEGSHVPVGTGSKVEVFVQDLPLTAQDMQPNQATSWAMRVLIDNVRFFDKFCNLLYSVDGSDKATKTADG
jgi:hypothetical protein